MTVTSDVTMDVLVLAGDRGADDPLVRRHNVEGKALIELGDQPLLVRVLNTLAAWPKVGRIVLVSPKTEAYQQALSAVAIDAGKLHWIEPQQTLFASIQSGLALDGCFERLGLLVTADHGLLAWSWLDAMHQALGQGAELAVALTDYDAVMSHFPNSTRTRYRFADRSISGGNLFAFRGRGIHRVLQLWSRLESERKKPWKMVSLLGPINVARYLSGRLTLDQAFHALSIKTQVEIKPVLIDDPAVAVDVDSPEDLSLAELILADRALGTE